MPVFAAGTPPATAALKPSNITRLAAAISAVWASLNAPFQPNILVWNERAVVERHDVERADHILVASHVILSARGSAE